MATTHCTHFPIRLHFDQTARVVFKDTTVERPVALFVFETPRDLYKSAIEFDQITISGQLRNEAYIGYRVVANKEFFAILLCDQGIVPIDSPLLATLSNLLGARRRPAPQEAARMEPR